MTWVSWWGCVKYRDRAGELRRSSWYFLRNWPLRRNLLAKIGPNITWFGVNLHPPFQCSPTGRRGATGCVYSKTYNSFTPFVPVVFCPIMLLIFFRFILNHFPDFKRMAQGLIDGAMRERPKHGSSCYYNPQHLVSVRWIDFDDRCMRRRPCPLISFMLTQHILLNIVL